MFGLSLVSVVGAMFVVDFPYGFCWRCNVDKECSLSTFLMLSVGGVMLTKNVHCRLSLCFLLEV